MDKGYDSKKIHALIREEIKTDSTIPLRKRKKKKVGGGIYKKNCIWSLTKLYRTKGIYQRRYSL
jgi:hypothetical protein